VLYVVADTNNHAVRQIGPRPESEQLRAKPQRPPLQRSLIACKTHTKHVKLGHNRHRRRTRAIRCTAKRVTGKAKLRGTARAHAMLRRGRVVYATGTSVSTGPGRLQMLVTGRRPLHPGRYTLTLRRRQHHHLVVRRMTITLA
jgi:hypothetical protein